jgi:hypothetical protein
VAATLSRPWDEVTQLYTKGGDFPVVAGLVQFEPRRREVNGQEVRDVKVCAFGSQQETWVTVWPEHAHVCLAAGDLVVVQGRRRTWSGRDRDGNPREYVGVDAKTLVHLLAAERQSPAASFDFSASGVARQ